MNEPKFRLLQENEHNELVDCIKQVYIESGGWKADEFDLGLWSWQYIENEVPSFVIVVEIDGKIIGYIHTLRFPMMVFDEPTIGGISLDIGILKDYRLKGLFGKMATYNREFLKNEDTTTVFYGFPNSKSLPGQQRYSKLKIAGIIPAYILPLQPFHIIAKKIPILKFFSGIDIVCNGLYKIFFKKYLRSNNQYKIEEISEFDEKIQTISQEFTKNTITIIRSSRFLNWRYFKKPNHNYKAFVAHKNNQQVAYIVTRYAEVYGLKSLLIMDLGCVNNETNVLLELIASQVMKAKSEGASLVMTMGQHLFFKSLYKIGFIRIPEFKNPRPFILISCNLKDEHIEGLSDSKRWFLTFSDYDVF